MQRRGEEAGVSNISHRPTHGLVLHQWELVLTVTKQDRVGTSGFSQTCHPSKLSRGIPSRPISISVPSKAQEGPLLPTALLIVKEFDQQDGFR